jgi:hypothetical protein
MKKIFIFSLLSCLPFTQLASVSVRIAFAVLEKDSAKSETASGTNTPVLPLNTLPYFIR